MKKQILKNKRNQNRKARVRAKIFGTAQRPRLNVFKSLKNTNVQLIDDENRKTLISANSKEIKENLKSKVDYAYQVGKLIATKAKDKKITSCVFDKSKYKYHGRVKAVAEGAREAGLNF